MIKIEYPEVYNFEPAASGFTNAFYHWSYTSSGEKVNDKGKVEYQIGSNDLKIMRSVLEKKVDEADFLKAMFVAADITAPLYWWQEFDNYGCIQVHNKFNLLQDLVRRPFRITNFSHENILTGDDLVPFKDHPRDKAIPQSSIEVLKYIVLALNKYRDTYLKTREHVYLKQLQQLLPASYNQKRLIVFDYYTLRKIYKEHRYDRDCLEWDDLCYWMESLPYAKEFIKNK